MPIGAMVRLHDRVRIDGFYSFQAHATGSVGIVASASCHNSLWLTVSEATGEFLQQP